MEETYSVLYYYVLETAEEKTVYLWIGAYRVSSVTPDCPALFLKAKKFRLNLRATATNWGGDEGK